MELQVYTSAQITVSTANQVIIPIKLIDLDLQSTKCISRSVDTQDFLDSELDKLLMKFSDMIN
ncbi:hypothetical protein [Vagococcus vulneris]|uniref:hypothetical protein n=1 Tax=Vagococcus vulneris TaxID=1977869 RepID=UPI001401FE5C|nr:hypothetical protein [Vagococcus vulneris]